jgi:hypothetical protein
LAKLQPDGNEVLEEGAIVSVDVGVTWLEGKWPGEKFTPERLLPRTIARTSET